jgi:transposase
MLLKSQADGVLARHRLKDFMEAGKGRLRGDAKREATSNEVQDLRQENERLKLLVADLSLANLTLKKSQY